MLFAKQWMRDSTLFSTALPWFLWGRASYIYWCHLISFSVNGLFFFFAHFLGCLFFSLLIFRSFFFTFSGCLSFFPLCVCVLFLNCVYDTFCRTEVLAKCFFIIDSCNFFLLLMCIYYVWFPPWSDLLRVWSYHFLFLKPSLFS